MERSDAELVARTLDGHAEAFAVLVERHYEDCARYARRMLGNRADAEDAIQDAFLRAYRGLAGYRERDRFRGWLFRIVVNRCRTVALERSRRARRVVQDERAMISATIESHEPGSDLRDALQRALDPLEPLLREAVLLKHGEGFDYAEMSRLTGASVPALKMRVKRGVDELRPRWEETSR